MIANNEKNKTNRINKHLCYVNYQRKLTKKLPTRAEEHDGFETAVLGRVHVQRFELLDLVLEHADVIHEGDHSVGGHRTGVESGSGQ